MSTAPPTAARLAQSEWRGSRYNFWGVSQSGTSLLLNGLTGALVEMEPAEASRVRAAFDGGAEVTPELVEQLAELGMMVPVDLDEPALLQSRAVEGCQAGTGRLELIIAPTYACNFRCTYCYVEQRPGVLSPAAAEGIVRHVERVLDGYSALEISWFGGEPLLCLDIVDRLTRQLRSLALDRGAEFRAFATTNGYLLDSAAVRRLEDAGVEYLHVTVDGSREAHDRLRVRADGGATYDVILSNLLGALKQSSALRFTLRANVDHDNISEVYDLMDAIPGAHRHRIQVSVRPIMGADTEIDDVLLAGIEDAMDRAVELGFLAYPMNLQMGKTVHCAAEKEGNYYIAPDARLYSCSPLEGKSSVFVGTLCPDGRVVFADDYLPRAEHRPFSRRCAECDFLCFCMGGCPLYRTTASDDSCKTQYANIEQLIRSMAEVAR